MTREEYEQLLFLLRKFHIDSGVSILQIEMNIIEFARSTPLFKVREGVFMDEKMAYEYDMQKMDDTHDKLEKQEQYRRD